MGPSREESGTEPEGQRCLKRPVDMSMEAICGSTVVGGTLGVRSKEPARLTRAHHAPGARPSPGMVPQAPRKGCTRVLAREGHRRVASPRPCEPR